MKDYKTNNPDNNIDAEEWKPGTSLIVGDSMIAGFRDRNYQETETCKKISNRCNVSITIGKSLVKPMCENLTYQKI